ncbi:hypothetical protein PFISCL1PPCAC_12658, partial [Pristionchus fissidentatus]
ARRRTSLPLEPAPSTCSECLRVCSLVMYLRSEKVVLRYGARYLREAATSNLVPAILYKAKPSRFLVSCRRCTCTPL